MPRRSLLLNLAAAGVIASAVPQTPLALEGQLVEIIVTARQQEESLRDVPVTIAAFSEQDLDRYHVRTLEEAAKLVPNFQIVATGSGSGSNLYLRGVGSSSISAAFDQSVAINLDGVVASVGRMISHGYLDMQNLQVLKGPQSLYFGKSTTAGVVSLASNNPADYFELEGLIAYEPEHDQTYSELIVSGPLTDTLGARIAVGQREINELVENLNPNVRHRNRGEDTLDARLTLLWEPTEALAANLKINASDLSNDGTNGRTENRCVDGIPQPTAVGGINVPNTFEDCRLNGNTNIADVDPALLSGNPLGNGGAPFGEQETWFGSLTIDWELSEHFTLTSVSGFVDLDHAETDVYSYAASGAFAGSARNTYEAASQELRLASQFEGPLNFLFGLYAQEAEQQFQAWQYTVNIGLVAPDPITGAAFDYNKNHRTESEIRSAFIAGYWDITPDVELTAGVRYTEEEKDGEITIPSVHAFLQGVFSAPSLIDGLRFDDENVSPEVAVNWYANNNVSLFAAYKQGFKSGGIDNSALPSAALSTNNPEFPAFLLYDSEQAEGFELGLKSSLLQGDLQLNATVYQYEYSDLQVQQFDAVALQFSTFNASELTTRGLEVDALWATPVDGLVARGALALSNAEYTDDFIQIDGQNLRGQDLERNADVAGFVGVSYERPLSGALLVQLSFDTRYNSGYALSAETDPFEQDAFWLFDAAVRLSTLDERYELAIIGRNLGDEIYAYGEGARPAAVVNPAASGRSDRVVTTALGAEYLLQFRVTL